MTSKELIEDLTKRDNFDYGLCPPPLKAEEGMQILIEHFLGKDWYTTLPLSQDQGYTEAVCAILDNNKKRVPFTEWIKRCKL